MEKNRGIIITNKDEVKLAKRIVSKSFYCLDEITDNKKCENQCKECELLDKEYKKSPTKAVIQDEFKAYEVSWICEKGHINFQTIIGKEGTQSDVCLKCGKYYEYIVE